MSANERRRLPRAAARGAKKSVRLSARRALLAAAAAALTTTGLGTLRLASANAFSGPVTTESDAPELRDAPAMGAGIDDGIVRLSPGATLQLRSDGPFPVKYDVDVFVADNAGLAPATIDIGRTDPNPQIPAGAFQLRALEMNKSTLVVTGTDGFLEFVGITTLRDDAIFHTAQRSLKLSGPVTGIGSLTKTGDFVLTLGDGVEDTQANNYAGLTTLKGGILQLNKAAGTNAIAGDIALDGGLMVLLRDRQISDDASMLLSGGTFDVGGSTDLMARLTQRGGTLDVGTGKLEVGASIFEGGTRTIGAGGLRAAPRAAAGGGGGSFVTDILTVSDSGTLVNAGATLEIGGGGLTMTGVASPTITLSSDAATPARLVLGGNVTASNTAGTATLASTGPVPIEGTVDLSAAVRQFAVNNGTAAVDMEITGRLINGGIRKTGGGTLRLTAANTHELGTTIAGGAVEVTDVAGLGTGGVTISNGLAQTLRLRNDGALVTFANDVTTNGGTIDVDRLTPGAAGTFQLAGLGLNVSGNGTDARLRTTGASGGTLEFTGAVTLATNGIFESHVATQLSGAIGGGAFGVTKDTGAAALTFAGATANTYTGLTRVNTGTLQLAKTGGALAIPGNLDVFGGGSVLWMNPDQVADAAALTINGSTSSMNLNGFDDTVGEILMLGGTLASGAGTLHMNGNVTTLASTQTATISGNVSLGAATRTFNVADGTAADDLLVSAAFSGTGGLDKSGAGTMRLTSAITLAGGITVGDGTLHCDGPVSVAALTIADGGVATLTAGGGNTLSTDALVIAPGGKLMTSDNDLIVDYFGDSPEDAIRQLVRDGRAPGSNSGIFSTPGTPSDDKVLAIVDNADWAKTSFNGIDIDPDTIVGKYTYFGDANLDGQVTGDDYLAVDSALGAGDSWIQGDFNLDNAVTGDDYLAIDTNLGKGTSEPLAYAQLKAEMVAMHTMMFGQDYVVKLAEVEANGFTTVPEPVGLTPLGVAAAALLGRRRRRAALA